jgi:low affinity Fe/Cu permease
MNFSAFSRRVCDFAGSPLAFSLAALLIVVWAAAGLVLGFSDTHQLIINTTTTIITFLMVFIIQTTQNTQEEAMQAKLDELIRVTDARDELRGIEDDA